MTLYYQSNITANFLAFITVPLRKNKAHMGLSGQQFQHQEASAASRKSALVEPEVGVEPDRAPAAQRQRGARLLKPAPAPEQRCLLRILKCQAIVVAIRLPSTKLHEKTSLRE